MQSSLYVGLSGQLALERQLASVANNVANASTAGYRAEGIKFETALSRGSADPVAFAAPSATYVSRRPGEIVRTDNPFDVAVKGDAWLAIQTPAGQVYTRDGRMQMAATGELQTLNGHPVLDVGGASLMLDPSGGRLAIAQDGTITQGARRIGAIGLFRIDPAARLSRAENSGVVPERPAEPLLEFDTAGVLQGFVERANVNAVLEISRLVQISRSFDAMTNLLSTSETSLKEAIRALGDRS